jgi:C_GCAxxG_C_C family probable redox protein
MENTNDLAKKAYDLASKYYLVHGGCPQCVLMAVKETIGFVTDDLIKASHPLSGGVSLHGKGTCGALTGGLLALGSKYGRDLAKASHIKTKKSLEMGKELIERHEKELGSFTCYGFQKQIHNKTFDMWNPEELEQVKNNKFVNNCAHITGKVAQWCVEMIMNPDCH